MQTKSLLFVLACFAAVAVIADDADSKKIEPFSKDWFFTSDNGQKERDAMVGKPMPGWTVNGWANGEKKPADLAGKIVIVDFWATWCGPCIASIPHTNEIAEKYKDQDVEVVAICCTNGAETMEAVVKEKGIKYSTAKDVEGKSAKTWNVGFWPTFVIIDRNAIVRGVGFRTDKVEDALKKILEEQPKREKAASAKRSADSALAQATPKK